MYINHHPEAQWYKGSSLGMFIHWGIGSLTGIDISWSMLKNKPWYEGFEEKVVPPEEYWKLAEHFKPSAYNPDKWLSAARYAEMQYAVFTTRHHDGYALWPSEYGNYSTKQYLDSRDLVGEYVDACRRQGLKVGLYYSLSDWKEMDAFYPDEYKNFEAFVEQPQVNMEDILKFERFFVYVRGQIKELLTRYGKIDILWFDHTIWNSSIHERMEEIYSLIRTLQPHILINDRGGDLGDFKTPECCRPGQTIEGLWESCYIWQFAGWGYDPREEYKDMDWTLNQLANTVSSGGNLLLNVGPNPAGELPEVVYRRLEELGEWMKANKPAIIRAERAPQPIRCNVPVTTRMNTWYLHMLAQNTQAILREVAEPKWVGLLRNGQAVSYTYAGGTLRIELEEALRGSGDEVIVITWPRVGDGFKNNVFQFEDESI